MKSQKYITAYGIKRSPINKVFKWKIGNIFKKKRQKVSDDDFKLKVNFLNKKSLDVKEDFIVWLGHATFYMQLGGVKILTDPVFGDIPMTPRLVPFPIDVDNLEPDIVLLSHGHYDHLDLRSLEELGIYTKKTKLIMPSNLSTYLKKGANVCELSWYDEEQVGGVTIEALPASHWHRRGFFDFNRALWCSFMIKYKNNNIFFAGDTALDEHFKEIKNRSKPIDIALMPIGAYQPREVMRDNHINPQEALEASMILGAKSMIPYHYGTFKLSDEPIGEPHSWITKLAKESEIQINVLEVGEILLHKKLT